MDKKDMDFDLKIDANRNAWSKLSKEHYEHFKINLSNDDFKLNPIVEQELGDIKGKKILHLQCNTGADSILLARKGAIVTGVDFSQENIYYAKKLAHEFEIEDIDFICEDVLKLIETHSETYDIVLTTDGVLGWIPDLEKWAEVVSHFLKEDGYFYLHDSHPWYLIFDENLILNGELSPKYPYFKNTPDEDEYIGGYASNPHESKNYFWGHQLDAIISSLIKSNLFVTYMKEYDRCSPGMGGLEIDENGLAYLKSLEGKLPLTISIKAKKYIK
ncbi:SAM-dependent methyltransferase [Acetoanaerobium pronyense]|uniref:SAM-dependent methyltransferase n=1 Tax=Acetoanaerobium pronyense TaxID=1482736 RepID=A0ABS4KHA8_9FIRM|nr:SAM-dependent methyltransferase [Acetoanaerobium pronyense]